MKVLIVCSGNAPEGEIFDIKIHQAFIYEQAESLKKLGIDYEFFLVKDKGIIGYIRHYRRLLKNLSNKIDIVHAHNGFCGFIANLQFKIPVVTTYHGSDINFFLLRLTSYFPIMVSAVNIFVSTRQKEKVLVKRRIRIIPCGVNINIFYPYGTHKKDLTGHDSHKMKILFSSSYSIPVKNYSLAKSAIDKIGVYQIEIIELRNKTRSDVCRLLNESDLLLMTSKSEGSPMIIKEAMACNCPIVSTDVGDVEYVLGQTEGCYLTTHDPEDISDKIKLALDFSTKKGRTKGRERIISLGLDIDTVASRIAEIYQSVLFK